MANIASSKKDIRRIARRNQRNRVVRSTLKTLRKNFIQVTDSKESQESEKAVAQQKYISAVDKAAKRGIVHRNKANRLKASCAKRLASTA